MKFKNRTGKKMLSVDSNQHNLFLAVTEMHLDMVINADITPTEARRIIIRDVNFIIDENVKEFTK
jgi:hypothetical protein